MNPPKVDLPLFFSRDLTTKQCVDGAFRITTLLLNGPCRIPLDNWMVRSMAEDAERDAGELSWRSGLERASSYTAAKQKAHRQRKNCILAIRREAKSILMDPDPAVVAEKGPAAKRILALVAKHHANPSDQSQAEMSTSVRQMLQECETPELAATLQEAGLVRLVELLRAAQASYVDIALKQSGEVVVSPEPTSNLDANADAEPQSKEAAQKPDAAQDSAPGSNAVPSRTLREIRTSLAAHFRIIFDNLAYLTGKGIEPYGALLSQCRAVTTELNGVVKQRDTREKKEKARQKAAGETVPPRSPATKTSGSPSSRAAAAPAAPDAVVSTVPDLAN